MSLAENLLDTLPVGENVSVTTSGDEEEPHIIIGSDRKIIIPPKLKTIAVAGDKDIETVTFDCVRYWDEHDLSNAAIYLNYALPVWVGGKRQEGSYVVPSSSITRYADHFSFDFTIGSEFTQSAGTLAISLTAKITEGDVLSKQWSSFTNEEMSIVKGLPVSSALVPEEEQDILSQVLSELNQKVSVNSIVNETGDSETAVMSQKAVTDALDELVDLRTAVDGKIYSSAGEAVRKQISEVKDDLDVLNSGGLNLKEDFIGEQVSEWLDEHPEATTTVLDGSLTEQKFTEALKLHTIKDYVTPQMFGAVGDGVADDTVAFVEAVKHTNVYVPSGTYKIRALTLDTTCHIVGESMQNTKIYTDGITIAKYACTIQELTIFNNHPSSEGGSGITFAKSSSYSSCERLQVFGFYIGIDMRALTSNFIKISIIDVTAGGRFAGFAIGDPSKSTQTNGIYLKRCYATACGVTNGDVHTALPTEGFGYGYYIFGGYAISLEDCIAEYCTGGGIYINASANRPLRGLNITNAYMENNRISQIYIANSSQLGDVCISKDIFISDSEAKEVGGYKRAIHLENADFSSFAWHKRGYGDNIFVTYSLDNLLNEALHKYDSLMPISAIELINTYSNKAGSGTITKDSDGNYIFRLTQAGCSLGGLPFWNAKANQVYELSFKYRRMNNDESTVKPAMILQQNGKNTTILATNIAYSEGYTERKVYCSFEKDGKARMTNYFQTADENTVLDIKDLRVKAVDFAKSYPSIINYPQEGFRVYDLSSKTLKTYIDGAWV